MTQSLFYDILSRQINVCTKRFPNIRGRATSRLSQRAFCEQAPIGFRWIYAAVLKQSFKYHSLCLLIYLEIQINKQGYRSGHNEAVLKTVWPKATWVRIPPPAPTSEKDTLQSVFFDCLHSKTGGIRRGKR